MMGWLKSRASVALAFLVAVAVVTQPVPTAAAQLDRPAAVQYDSAAAVQYDSAAAVQYDSAAAVQYDSAAARDRSQLEYPPPYLRLSALDPGWEITAAPGQEISFILGRHIDPFALWPDRVWIRAPLHTTIVDMFPVSPEPIFETTPWEWEINRNASQHLGHSPSRAGALSGSFSHFAVGITLRVNEDAPLNSRLDGIYDLNRDRSGWNTAGTWVDRQRLVINVGYGITQHPSDAVVPEGEVATFSTAGSAAAEIAWETSQDGGATWSPIPGATAPTYTTDSVTRGMEGWMYRAVHTFEDQTYISNAARLLPIHLWPEAVAFAPPSEVAEVVLDDPEDPRFGAMTVQAPTGTLIESAARVVGDTSVPFHVSADARSATSDGAYDWGAGTGNALLTLRVDDAAEPSTLFRDGSVIVRDGDVPRAQGVIAIQTSWGPPEIVEHPEDVTVIATNPAEFRTSSEGHDVRTQWQVSKDQGKTWEVIDGATGNSYTVGSTSLIMDGWLYRALHTNAAGERATHSATLTVLPLPAQASVAVRPITRLVFSLG